MAKRISDAVYDKTEQQRFNCECIYTAKRFYNDLNGFSEWLIKVSEKRNNEAALRLKKGVEWLWRRRDESE